MQFRRSDRVRSRIDHPFGVVLCHPLVGPSRDFGDFIRMPLADQFDNQRDAFLGGFYRKFIFAALLEFTFPKVSALDRSGDLSASDESIFNQDLSDVIGGDVVRKCRGNLEKVLNLNPIG